MSLAVPEHHLELLRRGHWELALAESIPDIKDLRDKAEAVRKYAKQAGLGLETQNAAAELKILAERKVGELLAEDDDFGRGKKSATVADFGLNHKQSARWQRLAKIPDDKLDYYFGEIQAAGDELTTAGLVHWRARGTNMKSITSSESFDWYTPGQYIEAAREVLGDIDLDPASSLLANEAVRATRIFTIDDDGLSQDWHGRVWMNPPYVGGAKPFVGRLIQQYEAGNVSAAIRLVNAHATDAAWFRPLCDHTPCFTDHRIDFVRAAEKSGSTHGSVFAYLGPDPARFAGVFGEFGNVFRR